jgi:hypothetical protein
MAAKASSYVIDDKVLQAVTDAYLAHIGRDGQPRNYEVEYEQLRKSGAADFGTMFKTITKPYRKGYTDLQRLQYLLCINPLFLLLILQKSLPTDEDELYQFFTPIVKKIKEIKIDLKNEYPLFSGDIRTLDRQLKFLGVDTIVTQISKNLNAPAALSTVTGAAASSSKSAAAAPPSSKGGVDRRFIEKREQRAREFPPPAGRPAVDADGIPTLGPIGPKLQNVFLADTARPELRTLEGLNAFIAEKYGAEFGEEDLCTVETGEKIGNYFTTFAPYIFSRFKQVFSSPNNSDCLIHSFLTAVCPNFRRLKSAKYFEVTGEPDNDRLYHKEQFARWFRNFIMPTLPSFEAELASHRPQRGHEGGSTVGEEAALRIFTPGVFLSDTDLGKLAEEYGISFLSFEGQAGNTVIRLTGNLASDTVFMVSNRYGAHFESVRTHTGEYTIPMAMARDINLLVNSELSIDSYRRVGMRGDPDHANRFINQEHALRGTGDNVGRDLRGRILQDYAIDIPAEYDTRVAILGELRKIVGRAQRGLTITPANQVRFQAENAAAAAEAAAKAAKIQANVLKNSRANYIQKRIAAGNATAFGFTPEEAKQEFGAVWNAAAAQRAAQKPQSAAKVAAAAPAAPATLTEAEYIQLIQSGAITMDNVPKNMKADVEAMLIALSSGGGRKRKTRKPSCHAKRQSRKRGHRA